MPLVREQPWSKAGIQPDGKKEKGFHLTPDIAETIEKLRLGMKRLKQGTVFNYEVVTEAIKFFAAANPHLVNDNLPASTHSGAILQGDAWDWNGFADEADFYRAVDLSARMIRVTDATGNCVHVSPDLMRFSGLVVHQFRDSGWKKFVHPDDIERIVRAWDLAFTNKQQYTDNYRVRRRTGEWVWVFELARARYRRSGEYAGYVGTIEDLSDKVPILPE